MNALYHNIKKGMQYAVFIIVFNLIVYEMANGGVFYTNNWSLLKLLLGTIGVSLGYSLPSFIYYIKRIPLILKIIVQMLIGSFVFGLIAYYFGWFIKDNTVYNIILICFQLILALLYLFVGYIKNHKLVIEINKRLRMRDKFKNKI
ncbi:MAG: DUF3021 family protein [Lachnospiraceae bacterium]|nr:DUF3021 family protein [Lachnospiraceae bacterium]